MKKQAILFTILTSALSLNANANHTYVGGSLALQEVSANTSTFRGWRPGLFIGFGGMMDDDYRDLYMGLELAGSLVGTISDTYLNRDQSLRMSPNVSLSVIPGMNLSSCALGYLRLGIGAGRVSVTQDWIRSAVMGVGVEFTLTPAWSLRTEYDYTIFRTLEVGTPKSSEFGLSLKYTYDA